MRAVVYSEWGQGNELIPVVVAQTTPDGSAVEFAARPDRPEVAARIGGFANVSGDHLPRDLQELRAEGLPPGEAWIEWAQVALSGHLGWMDEVEPAESVWALLAREVTKP